VPSGRDSFGGAQSHLPNLIPDCAIFLGGGALVAGVVRFGVPELAARGVDSLAAWMLLAPPLILAPIAACGWLLVRTQEGRRTWTERLRLQRPSPADWRWGILGLVGIGLGSAAMFDLCRALGLDPNPPFARGIQPWAGSRLWMLALWAVYWPANILGEEFVWRGVSLPRMQARLGQRAWILNAALWGAFHTAFGPGNLLVLLPTLIGVPWVAQRRRSTWLAVLMHAGLSGPGFVALALGLM
jgi:membrane protease YdiL (CAAX protease family)